MADVYIKPVPEALGGDANNPVMIARPAPRRDEIAQWEAEFGRLPDDYIAFLMAHNGGTVYPLAFRHNITDAPEFVEVEENPAVDILFTWDRFLEINAYLLNDWRADHVSIGYDLTSSMILISRRAQDFGAVRYWPRNVSDWDESADGPIPVGTVAPSFRDFIFSALYVDEDGGTPRWRIPADLETAVKVSF
ncbi:MAG: SMI1/KNR4 family protein [Paracoccaceae bacterium]